MTRKHFRAVAAALKVESDFLAAGPERATLKRIAATLCDQFARANPEFCAARFLAAAGLAD